MVHMNRKKVILITNIPTPYRVPLFNVMSRMFTREDLDLKVLFYAETYDRRKWKCPLVDARFDYKVLKSWKIRINEERTLFVPLNLIDILRKEKPSVIIVGGFSVPTLMVYLFTRLKKIPYILWSGEIAESATVRSSLQKTLRPLFVKKAAAFIAYGSKATSYLKSIDANKTGFIGINTVDIAFFHREVERLKHVKDTVLKELGLSGEKIHILSVGYLLRRKGFDNLLKALTLINRSKNHPDFMLHILGEGSGRERLVELRDQLGLEDKVIFWGFKQKEEMPRFYAIADIFVFPSLFDVWGLVLNEAMAAGLATISSIRAGATYDLLRNDEHGFAVDPVNWKALSQKLEFLLSNRNKRVEMGKKAAQFACTNLMLEESAAGFLKAVQFVA